MSPPLLVLGGGPAGLGVAHYAHRAGLRFVLLERSAELGGLCRTFRAGAHRYDAGAHRFHDRDPEVTADVRGLLGDEIVRVAAPSQVWDRGRLLDFPPTPIGLARQIGLRDAARAAVEVLGERRRRREPRTLADFATQSFGATLARRLVLDYSEKLWGLPAERLSPAAATRRLQGMTLRTLLVELVAPARRTAHLDGDFLYPLGGYGRIADALAATLPETAIRTGAEVVHLEVERREAGSGRVTAARLAGGAVVAAPGAVVSTLPLTAAVRLLGEAAPAEARAAAERLRFRHVRLVFLRLARERVSANASIYLPAPGMLVCRVSEPRNRSPRLAPPGETALLAEVPCFADEPAARLDDGELAERVAEELASIGLLRRGEVLEWRHHLLPNAYPVPELGHEAAVAAILAGLARFANLVPLGRGGRFAYSHLHDQLRSARDLVATLAAHGAGARGMAGGAG